NLPALFADSLAGGEFLMKVFEQVIDPAEADRSAEQLTALGNRILSANLVNLGEIEGIRPALEEMRNFLTIGLEHLTGGRTELGPAVLRKHDMQTIFKIGFDHVARLRDHADKLARVPGFQLSMLDADDAEFVEGLRRFKPLLYADRVLRNFQDLSEVDKARTRLSALKAMVESFLASFGVFTQTLARTFNTATLQYAIHGVFQPSPVSIEELEAWLAKGFRLPEIPVPDAIVPFAARWWKELQEELEPLVGKHIDPRFIASVVTKP